jgi:hypothetical protein
MLFFDDVMFLQKYERLTKDYLKKSKKKLTHISHIASSVKVNEVL